MSTKNIAVLAGDGIGPEVMDCALKVLDRIASIYNHQFNYQEALIGGAAYAETNSHCPDETLAVCESAGTILFGSVGGPVEKQSEPQWHNCEANSILKLRKHFDLAVNIRPVNVYPELAHLCPLKPESIADGIEMLIFRELTGGIYFGRHQQMGEPGERQAFDDCEYSEQQIRTIAEAAFKAASERSGRVCSVDKANVLATSKLWRDVVNEVAAEHPEIELSHMLVDNCAMQLAINPKQFDVVVTENMFGDILSDLAAALPGSLGLIPSASFSSSGLGLYEPSGGSAPAIAGQNIANPCAQILSAAMMLRHSFSMYQEATAIEQAVKQVISSGMVTADLAAAGAQAVGTTEFTAAVLNACG